MKILFTLYLTTLLSSCLIWDLTPAYSPIWNEDTWIHRKTKEPLSNQVHMGCRKESLAPFKTKSDYGLEEPVEPVDRIKSEELYASCLKNKGFIFSASFKYCYKFRRICDEYERYRE
ncbi:hypothetical protein [Actinobacillus porcinus]|uniref:hypothetical protein n=1 Tax=Actinobacillus porcinus TaxID=51048 RepID=UPI002A91092F|nr:hypothetical protein [Actinobacillus porcinus]MDY5421542.1 hypothetical protein [Actinobacillus porcinus]